MPDMKNPKVRAALRQIGAIERDFRNHANVATNKIIALAFADPNRALREPAQDCLERLVVLGGAKLSKSGLSKLTDSLERLEEVLNEYGETKSTPQKKS